VPDLTALELRIVEHLRLLAHNTTPKVVEGKTWTVRDELAGEYYVNFKDVSAEQAYEAADAFLKFRKQLLEKKP
jgi:hypothetical protein